MEMEKAVELLLESAARHESQLQAIRDVIQGGINMVVSFQAETNRKFDVLIDAQLRTEASLARLAEVTETKLARLSEAQALPNRDSRLSSSP